MSDIVSEHIHLVDLGGGPKPRVKGSRIRLEDVMLWHERLHWSPRKIVEEFPQLTLRDVYAALAYYRSHHDEIHQQMAIEDAEVREFMRQATPDPLLTKLRYHLDD